MPQAVNVWGRKYITYNFNFPSFIQSGETMSEPTDNYMDEAMKETVTQHVDEDGHIVKVIKSGQKTCEEEQMVEIFEDRKVLTKRVTEFVKPVVYKIKTEIIDACGNVVDVIVTELDDKTMNMSVNQGVQEPVLAAQSVAAPTPVPVRHVTKSYQEMMSLTRGSHYHRHNQLCDECGRNIEDCNH